MCFANVVEVFPILISIYPPPRESSPLLSVLYYNSSTTVFPTHILIDVANIFLDRLLFLTSCNRLWQFRQQPPQTLV
jgi:hypothetical protein